MKLEDRVERLELEHRRLKATGVVAVLAVGLVFLMGQAAGVPEEIKARRFSVVDANGMSRAILKVTTDGPGLILYDATSKARAGLVVLPDGPELALFDANSNARAVLNVTTDGPALDLTEATGKAGVILGVWADRPAWQKTVMQSRKCCRSHGRL